MFSLSPSFTCNLKKMELDCNKKLVSCLVISSSFETRHFLLLYTKDMCIAMKLCLRDQMRKQQTFCDTTTFLHEMTSQKRAQKFHTDDVSLPRSG